MSLNTSHRLIKRIGSSMLVVWTLEEVFMKYDKRLFHRVFRTVQIPVMTGISALDCNIPIVHQNDIEILGINLLKAVFIKHSQPPN